MQGAPKRHVNAEEMLAELKQALESSTRAPNAARPSASTAPKSSSPGREIRRSQMDGESDRPVRAKANSPVGQPNDLQTSTPPSSRRWTLTAGAIALTVAATIGVSFALMNKAPDSAEREPSVTATESLAKPQNEQNSQALKQLPLADGGQPEARAFASRQLGNAARGRHSSGKQRLGAGWGEWGTRRLASGLFRLGVGAPRVHAGSAEHTRHPRALASDPAGRNTNRNSAVHSRFDRFSAASGWVAEAGGPVGRPANGQAG